MMFDTADDVPEVDLSEMRVSKMLDDIKRNSRNRRIALFAPVILAAAVLGAMIAAPPQHGGLALVADAEAPDPQLPRVFGSNGVWRLAEPIEEAPAGDPGPADMIEAPTEPTAPAFTLSPPQNEDLQSLPTSTPTPPASTSGQSLASVEPATTDASPFQADPATLDWSAFSADIRIEKLAPMAVPSVSNPAVPATPAEDNPGEDTPAETAQAEAAALERDLTPGETATPPDTLSNDLAPPGVQNDGNVTVAVEEPHTERMHNYPEANPSTPADDPTDAEGQAFSAPATILPQSVLVYSAHVSVTVMVVDDDSSVIDWCNTRVDWGDGSVSRVTGADDAALCTASCDYKSTSSAASENTDSEEPDNTVITVNEIVSFEYDYTETIDASPRVFVATGDGCSFTLAELQLGPFTVVPLP
ncbi:MAG: hypothetical protein P8P20_10760 [Acidimicrobiales bacterium]|nr:hypothetical protein [Acidimicrobiales bacterium]